MFSQLLRLSGLGTDIKHILHVDNGREPFCVGRLHLVSWVLQFHYVKPNVAGLGFDVIIELYQTCNSCIWIITYETLPSSRGFSCSSSRVGRSSFSRLRIFSRWSDVSPFKISLSHLLLACSNLFSNVLKSSSQSLFSLSWSKKT